MPGIIIAAVNARYVGKQPVVKQVVEANGGGFIAPVKTPVLIELEIIATGIAGYIKSVSPFVQSIVAFGRNIVKIQGATVRENIYKWTGQDVDIRTTPGYDK